jgi:transcriptional regulator with XRE-family HTH domain
MINITHAELAVLYGICCKTLYNWLKEAKIERNKNHTISAEEQEKIAAIFGTPAQSITRAALAYMYSIDNKTLYNWLKRAKIELREACAICWKDQQVIFAEFGDPSVYKQKKEEKAAKRTRERTRKSQ